jgi:hypothetical protein
MCTGKYSADDPTPSEAGSDSNSSTASSVDSSIPDSSGVIDSSETDVGAPCPAVAGTWVLSGCGGDTVCTITQNGCSIGITCGPDRSLAGTVEATSTSFTGTVLGMSASCGGGPFGDDGGKRTFPGTCVIGGNPCTFTATQSN